MLIGEADLRMVTKDLDGFLKAAREVEVIPGGEVFDEVVDAGDAVLDEHAVHLNERIEVDTGAPVLYARNESRAKGGDARVVVAVLLHVDRVPVLRV